MIYGMDPFCKIVEEETSFPVENIEMLMSTSLIALVPAGEHPPRYPSNGSEVQAEDAPQRTSLVTQGGSNRQVILWNVKDRSAIGRLSFPGPVTSVRLNPERAVVCLANKVFIVDLHKLAVVHSFDRTPSVSVDPSLCALSVCPADLRLALMCVPCAADSNSAGGLVTVVDSRTLEVLGAVVAHDTPVTALAVSSLTLREIILKGRGASEGGGVDVQALLAGGEMSDLDYPVLATASESGTLVKVFTMKTLSRVGQFRRGHFSSRIHALSFDSQGFLSACAASGTSHVFYLPPLCEEYLALQPGLNLGAEVAGPGLRGEAVGSTEVGGLLGLSATSLHSALQSTLATTLGGMGALVPLGAREWVGSTRAVATCRVGKQGVVSGGKAAVSVRGGRLEVVVLSLDEGRLSVFDLPMGGGEGALRGEHVARLGAEDGEAAAFFSRRLEGGRVLNV